MSHPPYTSPTFEELLAASSTSSEAPSLREELRQLAQANEELRLLAQTNPVRLQGPPRVLNVGLMNPLPISSVSASLPSPSLLTNSEATTTFPSLLTSLAQHRQPRPVVTTGQPRIVRSSQRPSLSPSRRRSSVSSAPHASASALPSSPSSPVPINSPVVPYLKPRGTSFLSTIAAPGFPLPAYLLHSTFHNLLVTGQMPGGPGQVAAMEYSNTRPASPPPLIPMPSRRNTITRHSDSENDSVAVPTSRRRRSTMTAPVAAPPPPEGPNPGVPFYVPSKWSDVDKSNHMNLSADGYTITFADHNVHGESKDAATVRADHPIPPICGIYYFEVEVVERGLSGFVSLGLCTKTVSLARLPGWEEQSWGYHADDGKMFAFGTAEHDIPHGPKFSTGDTVGCGIDYTDGRVFFTKNGLYLGPAFSNVPSAGPLYPCVGLRSLGETLRGNFGQKDFLFDIDGLAGRRKQAVRKEITRWRCRAQTVSKLLSDVTVVVSGAGERGEEDSQSPRRARRAQEEKVKEKDKKKKVKVEVKEKPEEETDLRLPLDALVLDYLSHQAYAQTASALAQESALRSVPVQVPPRTMDGSSAMEIDQAGPSNSGSGTPEMPAVPTLSMLARQQVIFAIRAGNIDTALYVINTNWPDLLKDDATEVACRLECRKFVELMLRASESGSDPHTMSSDAMDTSPSGFQASLPKLAPTPPSPELSAALTFGQLLHHRYSDSPNPAMRALVQRTFALLAYAKPGEAAGEVGALVAQDARDEVAAWVNETILRREGRPDQPAIARAWAGVKTVMAQLGALGQGKAAYLDPEEEHESRKDGS